MSRALRICRLPGCAYPATYRGLCATHARRAEQQRGSRQQRGYGTAHDSLRARWAALVRAGDVRCWRCRQLIQPGEPWDLGHDDQDRDRYRGAEHARCNRSAGGRIGHDRSGVSG